MNSVLQVCSSNSAICTIQFKRVTSGVCDPCCTDTKLTKNSHPLLKTSRKGNVIVLWLYLSEILVELPLYALTFQCLTNSYSLPRFLEHNLRTWNIHSL